MRVLALLGLFVLMMIPAPGIAQGGSRSRTAQAPAVEQDPAAWREFYSTTGRFSVVMPGTPTEKTITLPLNGAQVDMHLDSLKTTIRYTVSYCDLPLRLVDPDQIKKLLQDTMEGGISRINGRLLEYKEIKLGSHPGYYMTVMAPDNSVLRSRSFLVERRFYQVTINTPMESVPGERRVFQGLAARFLDSFKLASQDN